MPEEAHAWPTLETPRLRLRRFQADDLAPFMAYRNDPAVARYQSWEHVSRAEAATFIAVQQAAPLGVPGIGVQIACELKDTRRLIGDCYFRIDPEDARLAEFGYTFAREAQGRGLATEAVDVWLTYAFDAFTLHRVSARVDCENARSVALLERLGLRREGHFLQNAWFKGQWTDEYLYAILREEWLARHGGKVG